MIRLHVSAAIFVGGMALAVSAMSHASDNQRVDADVTRTQDAAPQPSISISRIRVDVRRGRALITTDLTIPASSSPTEEDLFVHVSFGSPGYPSAFDAQLVGTPRGYLVAPVGMTGEKLSTFPSARSPSYASLHLGRPQMVGALVQVQASSLRDKTALTGQATLRLREVRGLPPLLPDGTRELVIRLGATMGKPLVVGLLEMASDDPIDRVQATFCGLTSSSGEVFVAAPRGQSKGAAAPLVRRALDEDLCLRFGPGEQATKVTAKDATR